MRNILDRGLSRHFVKILLPLAATAAFGLMSQAASAKTSGAHFMNDTSASVGTTALNKGALSVFIDEAGVGNQDVNYTLNWTSTADYGCINGGQNHPQATNKSTSSTGGQATASFSPINGRIQQTVDPVQGTPPPVTNGFTCPSGQTLVLADVSYSVTVTDTTNGNVSITLTASHTFFTFKK